VDATDPYRYGWRYVKKTLPDGKVEFDQIPLTLEDVLHPEENDFILKSIQHGLDCTYLADAFRSRRLLPPLARVTHDLRIDWGVPGLRAHGPDIAVFVGMEREPAPSDGTLYLAQSGGRCVLVVEVVSPHTRENDAVTKVDHYRRAGVPLYALIDQEREGGPRRLVAYRWAECGYQEAQLDPHGRLLIPELGLYLSVRDDRAVCHDAASDRELLDYVSLTQRLAAARRRNDLLTEAESLLRQAQQAARARDEAERLARDEAQARELAEKRILELEALLQRLQQGDTPAT
jgi:hypothetical protein